MERLLFARLWEEIDFDDHPLSGGHGPEPDGNLTVTSTPHGIRLEDSRISFILGAGDDAECGARCCGRCCASGGLRGRAVWSHFRRVVGKGLPAAAIVRGDAGDRWRRVRGRNREQLDAVGPARGGPAAERAAWAAGRESTGASRDAA